MKENDSVFIVHDPEAKITDEQVFFQRSAETAVTAAYKLANKIIDERYPVDNDNIYLFHFSDSDS